jgi:cysteinyl-tRNA synthetase
MAMKYLGETLDIHCGGVDLIFPHHENEIAQSEAMTGKPFARFWMHSEFLNVDAQKMAKSAGNFYTLRDLLAMGYAPEAVRYLLLSVPYRKKLNFTFDGLQAAATAIDRLRNFKLRLDTDKFGEGLNEQIEGRTASALQQFEESLDDDLNTAEALGAIFEYVRDVNTSMDNGEFLAGNLPAAVNLFDRFDAIVDVLKPTQKEEGGLPDPAIEELIAERVQAKKAKNFARSDEIRKQLLDAGVILEDTKEGTRWKRK